MQKKKSAPVSRSGRFASGPAADVAQFSESISFDYRLWEHDIIGSLAHATMLRKVGLLTARELKEITRGLETIATEIQQGIFEWKPELEDVHMNIEAELTRRVPAGAKLHTARSRNDQVALDVRLWLRDQTVQINREIRELQQALVQFGRQYSDVIIPGYTHVQRAQPVYFAHHLLAYVEMLERDHDRFIDGFVRMNVCPLGSGAIAGSTLPLDREMVADMLGFVDAEGNPRVSQNSMDAVSDRDFVVEFCSHAALVAMHLSRLAEDVILWASAEFQFIKIADAYTTGSSLMPQKKNPDVAELTRGKSARVIGNLVALLTLLKGLPMTYNRDLQEDKEPLFDSVETIRGCLRLMAGMIQHSSPNRAACAKAAQDPSLLATDLADYLVRQGVPFRHAHHAVGKVVARAEELNVTLKELSFKEYQAIDPHFCRDIHELFDLEKAMDARTLTGSPGRKKVLEQLTRWEKLFAQEGPAGASDKRPKKAKRS